MKRHALPLLLSFSLILSACAMASKSSPASYGGEPGLGIEPFAERGSADSGELFAPEEPAASPDFGSQASAIERIVIRNATISAVVADPSASAQEISAMAEGMGGFVVSSYVYQTSLGDVSATIVTRASVTVRVPVERLDEALERIRSQAIEVRSENITGEDVTQQYTDLRSRLRNLEAAESRLLEIMDSAEETEDVLQVFQDLRQVQEQIEVLTGQIRYYDESARLSAISVELIPDAAAQPIQIGGWRPQGTVKQAIESLIRSLQFLADAGIWLVICVLPIALLFALPASLVARAIVRRRRQARAAEDTAPPPAQS
jgi:hypothetical protein